MQIISLSIVQWTNLLASERNEDWRNKLKLKSEAFKMPFAIIASRIFFHQSVNVGCPDIFSVRDRAGHIAQAWA